MTVAELKGQREPLKAKKQLLTQQLLNLKQRLNGSGRLPANVWQDLQSQRSQVVRQLSDLDAQISAFNTQIARQADSERWEQSEVSPALPTLAATSLDKKAVISSLNNLRQHYQQFAADTTRVRSKRDMAAEFVVKLTEIIRENIRHA